MFYSNITRITTLGVTLAFSIGASAQALYVTPTGDIGIGTDLPISSLEVTRDDGTAKVLVNEASESVGSRTLFQLSNKGNTKFGVLNTDASVEWAFANPGTAFRISRQGSGVVEMELLNNGNMTIQGMLTELSDVNAKQDIEPVNSYNILEKISQLEISEWSYKDAPGDRHVGPMAQDFYAAFGLGNSDKGIATMDSSGIALAAIKALAERNRVLEEKNKALEAAVAQLQKEYKAIATLQQTKLNKVDQLEQMVIQLMQAQENTRVLTSTD